CGVFLGLGARRRIEVTRKRTEDVGGAIERGPWQHAGGAELGRQDRRPNRASSRGCAESFLGTPRALAGRTKVARRDGWDQGCTSTSSATGPSLQWGGPHC